MGGKKDSPTAAFRLLDNEINSATKTILNAHTRIFAMLPKLPLAPAFSIPHCGFTPTGADFGSADAPVKVVRELSAICG